MKFVIDTNIFVSSLSGRSKYHWVIEALMDERYIVVISHEILLEYEEVLKRKYGDQIAENFLRALKDLPNVELVDIYFHWKFLPDADDDKFVDAFVSGGADFIVSEDSDFRSLQNIQFPKVKVIRLEEFKEILEK